MLEIRIPSTSEDSSEDMWWLAKHCDPMLVFWILVFVFSITSRIECAFILLTQSLRFYFFLGLNSRNVLSQHNFLACIFSLLLGLVPHAQISWNSLNCVLNYFLLVGVEFLACIFSRLRLQLKVRRKKMHTPSSIELCEYTEPRGMLPSFSANQLNHNHLCYAGVLIRNGSRHWVRVILTFINCWTAKKFL